MTQTIVLLLTLLCFKPAWAQLSPLTCGTPDKCKDVSRTLPQIENEHFAKIPADSRRGKFVSWIKPFALHLQAITGFPASVLIAQAGYHSDWGASPLFRSNFNLFSHMCWREKTVVETAFEGIKVKATCMTVKGDPKNRLAYAFAKAEDSILFYISSLLKSRNRHFLNTQNEVKTAFTKAHPGVAHYRVVVGQLGGFLAKENYRSEIGAIIESERLVDLDAGPCQTCLFQARRLKMLMEKTGSVK